MSTEIPDVDLSRLDFHSGVPHLDGALRLHCNESPYGPPPVALAAAKNAVETNGGAYPESGSDVLRQRIAEHHGVSPDMVLVGNGADELVMLTNLAFVGDSGDVLVTQTSFPGYPNVAAAVGATVRTVPLESYRVPVDSVRAGLRDHDIRLAFVCNPHNPTGTALVPGEIELVANEAERSGTVLVLDEAYMEYASPEYEYGVGAVRRGRSIIVLRTFSKAWGLAGMRVGYALGSADLIARLYKARLLMPFGVNAIAQDAAAAALTVPDFVGEVRERVDTAKNGLYKALEAAGIGYVPSAANFVMVHTGGNSAPVVERLADRHGILVRDLTMFGIPDHLRVTIGTPAQTERFGAALIEELAEQGPDPRKAGGTRSSHSGRSIPTLAPIDPVALFNGHVGAKVVYALEELGAWRILEKGTAGVDTLATALGAEPDKLRALLRVMALAGYLELNADVARLTDAGHDLARYRGFFVWGVGGYGELLDALPALTTGQSSFGEDVGRDEGRIAAGSGQVGANVLLPIEQQIVKDLEFTAVADLGCGSGARLIRYCAPDPARSGLGIEVSKMACDVARERVAEAGLADRVNIECGDVLNQLDDRVYPGYDLVTSFLMMHDLFDTTGDPTGVLRKLRRSFPDARHFLVADTYARDWHRHQGPLPMFSVEFELVHAFMKTQVHDQSTYEAAFAEAGLCIEWCEPFGVPSTRIYLLSAD